MLSDFMIVFHTQHVKKTCRFGADGGSESGDVSVGRLPAAIEDQLSAV
jgi:hypothetical protein